MFRNENINEDMIEILKEIQSQYVPTQVYETPEGEENEARHVQDKIFFGGDQLTEERSRNAQLARRDGDSEFERLDGVIPKVEDWHAGRIIYQVHTLH